MPDIRLTIFILGNLLIVLAIAMLIPAGIDWLNDDMDWRTFVLSAAITSGAGGAMVLGFRSPHAPALSAREGFILTTATWLVTAAFATLPLMLSTTALSFSGAYFETMSGLTTSGGTVITTLNVTPKGILLWRALLQWLGGVGIIAVAVAILPLLRVGGMQLFRMESSDKSEKIRPRVQQVVGLIILVYLALTALCVLALMVAGMGTFDSISHAMSAISTGGFSTKDASIAYYQNPAVEWVLTTFMALGGCTFVLLARAALGDFKALWDDSQTRWYFGYMAAFSLVLALWQIVMTGRGVADSLRSSAFNVVSIATTTGFVSEDYTLWGSLPIAAIMVAFFIGGCTGSTSGAVKVFRFCVLGSVAIAQIRHLVHPNRMLLPTYNGKPISDDVIRSVLSFFFFYIGAFAILTIAISAFGLDLVTAMSGIAQALGNVGPGLGPVIGPVGNYSTMPDGALWILSAAMLLGRLELLTVLVLFSPNFWRG
ncbi:MAG: TrkH family potassium uptake protein [Dongiaceae bacterium]